jgi:hypothetical protein
VPAARRRQTLFQLWLECEDSPGGAQARQAVEAAIRQHLPAGRPEAYGAEELGRLNRSLPAGQRFEPY